MANDLFTANAVKWMESIGYPVASLATPWTRTCPAGGPTSWQRPTSTPARRLTRTGRRNKVKVRSCTPADMVCEDMANLLYNEKASHQPDRPQNPRKPPRRGWRAG